MPCVHFVAFTPEQLFRTKRIFGQPHYVHPRWDVRAEQEYCEGDVIIYANNTPRRAEERDFFLSLRQPTRDRQ